MGKRTTAKTRYETNGAGVTIIAANTTFNSFQWQAVRADKRFVGPRCLFGLADQGEGFANGHAIAAECTFTPAEIDGWKAAIARNDDLVRAGAQAIVAARATICELGFR